MELPVTTSRGSKLTGIAAVLIGLFDVVLVV